MKRKLVKHALALGVKKKPFKSRHPSHSVQPLLKSYENFISDHILHILIGVSVCVVFRRITAPLKTVSDIFAKEGFSKALWSMVESTLSSVQHTLKWFTGFSVNHQTVISEPVAKAVEDNLPALLTLAKKGTPRAMEEMGALLHDQILSNTPPGLAELGAAIIFLAPIPACLLSMVAKRIKV
jgi:hypothetical protein